MVTSTVPLPGGEIAVIELSLLTVKVVALVLPNWTAVAVPQVTKRLPVIVTLVPPGRSTERLS